MSLFPCPDCGHSCSTAASSCPSCGRPFNSINLADADRRYTEAVVSGFSFTVLAVGIGAIVFGVIVVDEFACFIPFAVIGLFALATSFFRYLKGPCPYCGFLIEIGRRRLAADCVRCSRRIIVSGTRFYVVQTPIRR